MKRHTKSLIASTYPQVSCTSSGWLTDHSLGWGSSCGLGLQELRGKETVPLCKWGRFGCLDKNTGSCRILSACKFAYREFNSALDKNLHHSPGENPKKMYLTHLSSGWNSATDSLQLRNSWVASHKKESQQTWGGKRAERRYDNMMGISKNW